MSMEDAKQIFAQESEELLVEMEDALLELESSPEDPELINALFRAMHTIKGAAGVFGFDAIVEFTHPIETEVDLLRSGERPINAQIVSCLIEAKDHTSKLVDLVVKQNDNAPSDELLAQGQDIITRLSAQQNLNAPAEEQGNTHVSASTQALESMLRQDTQVKPLNISNHWMISLQFGKDALKAGLDPISFIQYLTKLGEILEIITVSPNMPNFNDMDFEECYLGFRIALISDASKQEIEEVFEFARDDCHIRILPSKSKVEDYLQMLEHLPASDSNRLGEILVQIGALTESELNQALNIQEHANADKPTQLTPPLGEVIVEQRLAVKPIVEQALKKQQAVREQARHIRVDSEKLGQLINLVGELVISSASMKVMVEKHNISEADEVIAGVEHLVEDIRNHALQLRMVQIGDTFSRFRRVVRDVSKDLSKKIDLVISGGESELDKTVVEKMNDPLTHLIRNSLDHGIETPEQRALAGKPETGVLSLNAFHDSGHIVIEVKDDGAGLDPDKIRAKAEATGLIQPDQALSKAEILRLIFEPGFSTKQKASNLSGRGVGMDVVRRNIEALRGNVELDSELGVGTTITIQLPLTLAIIDGFMVGAGGEDYVIPLSMVEECVEMDSEEWSFDHSRDYINLRNEVMPFLRLKDFFGQQPNTHKAKRESLVVVRFGRTKAGFVVDRLYGEQQTVIKPLGRIFEHLQGVSGATVLGSGEIALILDVQGLVQVASQRARGQKTQQAQQASHTSLN